MKKYIAILILILSCQAGYGQSMDKLFNDFANQKNVTRVTVGPFLMKLSSLFTETMGVKSIEVLSFEECSRDRQRRPPHRHPETERPELRNDGQCERREQPHENNGTHR